MEKLVKLMAMEGKEKSNEAKDDEFGRKGDKM